jgi:hypothetical protein
MYCYRQFVIHRYIDSTWIGSDGPHLIDDIDNIMQQQDICIEKGELYTIEIILIGPYIGQEQSNTCKLVRSTSCKKNIGDDASIPDCLPDCPQDTMQIGDEKKYISDECPDCEITVYYKYRQACGGAKKDIQLTNLVRTPLPGAAPGACNNCTEAVFMKEALLWLLENNPMGFEKPTSGCDTTWRVAQANCWMTYYQYDILNGVVDSVIVRTPCESACCVKPLLVCYEGRGKYSYDNLPSNQAALPCDPNATARAVVNLDNFYIPNGAGCKFSCEDLEGLRDLQDFLDNGDTVRVVDNGGAPARILQPQSPTQQPRHVEMYVQQENEMLIAEFWNSTVSDVTIGVYNLTGQLLEERSSTVRKGIATLQVDLSKYASGTYLMTISVDGIVLKSGPFQIVK